MANRRLYMQMISFLLILGFVVSLGLSGCSSAKKATGPATTAESSTPEATGKPASETENKATPQPETEAVEGSASTEGQRSNFFGIHTMINNNDNIDQHLDWAHNLVGDGGYIKQMFSGITKDTKGPSSNWVDILKGIYKRNMIPIIRVSGVYTGEYWLKPEATAPGDYSELAAAIKRVVEQLPLKKGVPLYIEVFNEPNLTIEWSNSTPNPTDYGHFLVDVSKALRSIGDPRIKVLNGALSPGGNYNNIRFVEDMIKTVPESLHAFDFWATHPYPYDHEPEYNNHDKTAKYKDFTIDSYTLELELLEKYGRKDTKVVITETGYELGNNTYGFEGKKAITEELRTDYIMRAFRDYWIKWPEIISLCPFEMVSMYVGSDRFDWIYMDSGSDEKGYPTNYHPQYEAVASLPKPAYIADPTLKDTEDKNMELVSANSSNLALKAIPTCSTSIEDYGWSLKKVNNGFTIDTDLGWTTAGDEIEEWLVLEFPQETEMSKVVMVPRSDGAETGKYFPQAFEIQVSSDGKGWTAVHSVSFNMEYNPGAEAQTYTFVSAKGKFLRLLITKKTNHGSGGYHAQLSEVEVY